MLTNHDLHRCCSFSESRVGRHPLSCHVSSLQSPTRRTRRSPIDDHRGTAWRTSFVLSWSGSSSVTGRTDARRGGRQGSRPEGGRAHPSQVQRAPSTTFSLVHLFAAGQTGRRMGRTRQGQSFAHTLRSTFASLRQRVISGDLRSARSLKRSPVFGPSFSL